MTISTLLEVAGLACLVAAAAIAAGPAAGFAAAGACLLFTGYAAEGSKTTRPAWLARPSWPQKLRRKGTHA